MELWRQYRFVRYVSKYPSRRTVEYGKVLNDYRSQNNLEQYQIDELWNGTVESKYLEVVGFGYIRVRSKGKHLMQFGFYGFVNVALQEFGSPLLVLAGVASIVNLIVIIINRH